MGPPIPQTPSPLYRRSRRNSLLDVGQRTKARRGAIPPRRFPRGAPKALPSSSRSRLRAMYRGSPADVLDNDIARHEGARGGRTRAPPRSLRALAIAARRLLDVAEGAEL